MKLDSNLAWKQASAMVAANRDLLVALAGVFFFLPSLALIMLIKQPQVPPGTRPEAVLTMLEPFLASIAPWVVIGSLVQTFGQLTLLDLFGPGERATVGQAMRKAFGRFPTYFVAQLLIGFVMTALLFFIVGVSSLVSPVLGLGLGAYVVAQAYARFLVTGAVIVHERQLNPILALVRAAALTRGNGFRLGNFLFLLVAAFFVGFMVLTIVIGIVAALTMGQGRPADLVTGFFSSAITAAAIAYFMAVIAAVYRQLAGSASEPAAG